ncbi:MAG TPA: hypothetical protein VHP33_15900 [Polyangiaceae bacterium]|nr:hypothetical protein [Polyangiaceae bacterium]
MPTSSAAAPKTAVATEAGEPTPSKADALASGLRLGGYIQGQYQHSDLSEDQLQQGGAPLNQTQFLVRRARVRIDRTWDYAAGSLELDANTVRGPRIGIRRAEASVFYRGRNAQNAPPLVALSVGVLDIPFGCELGESARTRWFMDRSLGSLALFPTEPDAGAKVWGAISFVRYAVAIMNGEPVDESGFPRDPNAAKDVLGRFGAEGPLGSSLELSGGTSFAVGKGFHRGQDAGKASVVWSDINEDGTHQPTEFVGVPGSAATPSENFKRWAIGLDLGVSLKTKLGRSRLYGEAFVGSNYDRGYAPSDPVSTRLDARQAGGYLAVTQELTRYGIVGFRASIYDPNSDIIETRGGKTLPKTQTVKTLSPLLGVVLPERARLLLQYDFIKDYQARDKVGVPTDANNNQWTLRLQVEL